MYKFLDENQEPLYVGKTRNLTGRIRSTHFAGLGHLPDECYDETAIVVYSQCLSESDMAIQERYLINTLKPKYNDKLNNGDAFGFTINCFDWKYLPFVRPQEKARKPSPNKSNAIGLLTFELPMASVQVSQLVVPSLKEIGTFSAIRDFPGELHNLYWLGTDCEPLRGLWMNDQLWLSALSIVEFCNESCSNDHSSKIRAIQLVKRGYISCEDVTIVHDAAFCRSDFRVSFWGKHALKHRHHGDTEVHSSGLLIRAHALEGFVKGLLDRHIRNEKKRFEKGVVIKATYRSATGDYPTKRCTTIEEYCDFMAGPNRTNANVYSAAFRIRAVGDELRIIQPAKREPISKHGSTTSSTPRHAFFVKALVEAYRLGAGGYEASILGGAGRLRI